MKHMNWISLLLAVLLAVAAPLTGLAQEDAMYYVLEGLVTEVVEGGFLMEDITMGEVMINTDENTVMDGILSQQPIEAGMYVIVDHNGMMTRSIPPQVYGLRVGCYVLSGVAGEFSENGVLLTGDPIFGEVFVQMTTEQGLVMEGAPMVVYYDGVMTMSLPGKVNARYVVVPQLTGVVSEKDGAGFTLTDENGNSYRILTSDELLVGELASIVEDEPLTGDVVMDVDDAAEEAVTDTDEAGAEEAVAEETASDEAEPAAEATVAESTDEAVAEEAGEEADAALIIEWGDGDLVTVYHQGPIEVENGAELVALAMLVHR